MILVGIYNQNFQGTIFLIVLDLQGLLFPTQNRLFEVYSTESPQKNETHTYMLTMLTCVFSVSQKSKFKYTTWKVDGATPISLGLS